MSHAYELGRKHARTKQSEQHGLMGMMPSEEELRAATQKQLLPALGSALGGTAGVGAALGGGLGSILGYATDPGKDEEGNDRSRLWAALRGGLGGSLLGAGTGLAVPFLGGLGAAGGAMAGQAAGNRFMGGSGSVLISDSRT